MHRSTHSTSARFARSRARVSSVGVGRPALRAALVWCLIGALAVYATSGSLLRMLGPQHWHATPPAGLAAGLSAAARVDGPDLGTQVLRQIGQALAQVQALADAAHARAHALGAASHGHSHIGLLRHWHGADDDSVRVLGAQAQDPALADLTAGAALGSATLLLGTGPQGLGAPARAEAGAWPAVAAAAWVDADLAPPAEPPIG
ncbi:hypothetical protein AACH10_07915 [Ideonella sp. DXS22W]|uniref:DUF2939 domain-containing protein n=1 Tax=Pseudaquabacterium inlustre TaxID=2984192 RepID=A0ABU9CGV3_9BURK